jgi:hypothetical protein
LIFNCVTRETFMTRTIASLIAIAALANPLEAQSLPPIRQLGPVIAVAKEPLGAVSTVRHLPDGRVLVNDIIGRRVVMFDSSLSTSTLIADTTSATASAYGVRPGGMIAYRGDSTLFIDPASLSMLLIDPNGKIARVMSAPRAGDVGFLVGGPFGNPGFDQLGRLVYRAPPSFMMRGPPPSGNRLPDFPSPPDSAALVRFDLATRKLDTATFFKTPKITMNVTRSAEGGMRVNSTINPLMQGDDWAILSDGTIALVRTKDYHVDWLSPQGTLTSSPKIPFQWERLSDEAKVALVDSAKAAIQRARESGQFAGGGGPGGVTVATGGNTTVTTVGAGGGAAGGLPREITMVSPSELPDYRPAFAPGSTRADTDGNLWIRTSQHVEGIPVYNVINRKGELIDRVQLPKNRVLAGFGPGGVVYLAVREGSIAHLEKARVR